MKTGKTLVLRIGMLWFDETDDIYEAISGAAAHYFSKFGKSPEYCHVHPEAFGAKWPSNIANINMRIRPDRSIRPKHVWVGVTR